MRLLTFISLFFILFGLSSCSHKQRVVPRDIASLKQTDTVEGIWFLQGTSSIRGPYNGELEFRKSNDGTFDVVRIITYINYFYEGLKVQEVWTGKAVAADDSIVISYELIQADFISKLNDIRRDASQFTNKARVDLAFKPAKSGLATSFSDRKGSQYSEWMTTRRDIEKSISWKDKRVLQEVQLAKMPTELAKSLEFMKKKIGFYSSDLAKKNISKTEFKNSKLYLVSDPTDFEFYRSNKDAIRIVNKVTDDISIAESVVKRNAYAPTLNEKAQGYDKNTPNSHLNEAGVIAPAYISLNGDLKLFEADRDSALRTGLYLATQSMRYSVQPDKEALENIKKALRGVQALLEISDSSNNFARTLAVFDLTNPLPEGWRRGSGRYANYIWLPGGQSEHLNGIIHGLSWVAISVPASQAAIHDQLKYVIHLLEKMNFVQANEIHKSIVLGLTLMSGNSSVSNESALQFLRTMRLPEVTKSPSSSPWFVNWRKVNLELMNYSSMVLISNALQEKRLEKYYRNLIYRTWLNLEPYKRPLIDLALLSYVLKSPLGEGGIVDLPVEKVSQAQSRVIWSLREIPYPRPSFDVTVDHSKNENWSLSSLPRELLSADALVNRSPQSLYQGVYAYPVFEMQAYSSSFLWSENPFDYTTKQAAGLEMSGVDYLYAYWLARLVGIKNVQ